MKVTSRIVNPDPKTGIISLTIDGRPRTLRAGDKRFIPALGLLRREDFDGLVNLMAPALAIKKAAACFQDVTVTDDTVLYRGVPVHNVISERIMQFQAENLDYLPLMKFLDNLARNPFQAAVDSTYAFLEHKGFPITDEGNFQCYKGVRADYKDAWSGIYDNHIGSTPRKKRRDVNPDRGLACSYGFHVGTYGYASRYAPKPDGHVMLVDVNPRDVVSIPQDATVEKLRTCQYHVVGETTRERDEVYVDSPWPSYLDVEREDDED